VGTEEPSVPPGEAGMPWTAPVTGRGCLEDAAVVDETGPTRVGPALVTLPDGCSGDGWCWRNPLPQGNDLNAISRLASGDLAAVGSSGTVLVGQPERWLQLPSPTRDELVAVWGQGADALLVAARSQELGTWQFSSHTFYAHDGTSWWRLPPLHHEKTGTLLAWASAPDDLHIVSCGRGMQLWHYDGSRTRLVVTSDDECIRSEGTIAGSAADHVVVKGQNLLWQFDGRCWEARALPFAGGTQVATSGRQDIVVAADFPDERSYRFDGARWRALPVTGLAVPGDSRVEWSRLRIVDGALLGWARQVFYDPVYPPSAPRRSTRHLLLQQRGDGWSTLAEAGLPQDAPRWLRIPPYRDVASRGNRTALLVGQYGTMATLRDDRLAPSGASADTHLYALWGTASGDDVYAVGDDGLVLHRHAGSWRRLELGVREPLRAVFGRSAGDVYVAGGAGTILHFDGSRWAPMPTDTRERISALWSADDGTLHAASVNHLLRLEGGRWQRIEATLPFRRLWSGEDISISGWSSGAEVLVTGARLFAPPASNAGSGYQSSFDGNAWTETELPVELHRFWSAGDQLFAVGVDRAPPASGAERVGTVYRRDGASWSPVASAGAALLGLHGTAPDDLYAVGIDGAATFFGPDDEQHFHRPVSVILHFDGQSWRGESTAAGALLRAVWATPRDVIAVGDGGAILEKRRTSD
jgi:hypothetical protein